MSKEFTTIEERLSAIEKRLSKLEGSGKRDYNELNPNLEICKACGEGNVRFIEQKVRDDIFGKEMRAMMKVYRCDNCSIQTQVNDSK